MRAVVLRATYHWLLAVGFVLAAVSVVRAAEIF